MTWIVPAVALLVLAIGTPAWAQQGAKITPILKATKTMTGQDLEYLRTDKPEVTFAEVEIQPGGQIGHHMHPSSGFVYILDGTLTVIMDDGSKHEYATGQAFVESKLTWHNATNTGARPLKLLVIWPGEEGKPNILRPPAAAMSGTAKPQQ